MPNTNKTDSRGSAIAKATPTAVGTNGVSTRARTSIGAVHFAIDVADRSQSTIIGVLHDARTEFRVAVDSSIELADKATAATLRLARKVVQRIDDLASETLASAERSLAAAVHHARESAHAAAERASAEVHAVAEKITNATQATA